MTTNLFEQFSGADLYRLADCITAISKAGLQTSKHTQAGVNQSTGNVWVWDEDWAGCVYCSIGFDVAWMWTCPQCGEEYTFDTYQEMTDKADRENNDTDGLGCERCRFADSI